jgi:hypothetical protein
MRQVIVAVKQIVGESLSQLELRSTKVGMCKAEITQTSAALIASELRAWLCPP